MTTILPYFRGRLDLLGFTEWTDALNFDNIPSTLIASRYHLDQGTTTFSSQNQLCLEMVMPVTVRLFYKAFRNTGDGRDESNATAKNAILDISNPQSYASENEIAVINVSSYDLTEITADNDNLFVIEINFNVVFNMEPTFT